MNKSISFEIALKRLNEKWNNIIEFKEEDYIGWNEKCKVFDLISKEWFECKPKKLSAGEAVPPSQKSSKAITFEKANKKFIEQGRKDIELCEDGYNGWSEKSKFRDKIVNDYFYSTPDVVYRTKSAPLRREGQNSLFFKEAKQRFVDQGRTDIELCEDGYILWSKKSKFYDLIEKDYFFAVPAHVYINKSCHPERAKKNRKLTNLKKYGCENVSQNKQIKEKKKQIFLEKYNVETNLQAPEIRQKIKENWLEKYNCEFPQQNETIKQKQIKTVKSRYGVNNYFQTNEVRLLHTTKTIKETGEYFIDWYKKQPDPKPATCTLYQMFPNEQITLNELETYFSGYKTNKTSLEVLGEQLFNTPHHNKQIPNILMKYRPDFKLSENIYVNVDGLYWHSEKVKSKPYHFDMRKEYEKNNLRLFQFYSDEIEKQSHIVKSIVDNALGRSSSKIFARKCLIKTVEQKEANMFLEANHLMGTITSKHIGLYFNNELVTILSYKEKKNICKIDRFCSVIGANIIGAYSKLLKHLEQNCLKPFTTEIHNWIDLRYGIGEHLESKGFKLIKETLGWKWADGENTFNRLQCRANMDERRLTESQHAEEFFWFKVYDAGQRLYVKYL